MLFWEFRRENAAVVVEAAASAMTYLKLDRVDAAIAAVRRELHRAEKGQGGDATETLVRVTRLQALRKRIEARAFLQAE